MQFGSSIDIFPCFTRLNPCVAHCSADSIPWVHHSREEGSLDYDGGFVRLQIHMNFDTIIYRQQRSSPPSPTPSRALHHHLLHCAGTGRQDVATLAVVRLAASRQPHPRANVRTTTQRATLTPPPSKPLLDGCRARHDAPPDTRFARTAVYSVALYTMPSHVDKQCGPLVNCRLLGL
jgi:hypothetical protein